MATDIRDIIRSGIESHLHIGAQVYVSLGGKVVHDVAMGIARPATEHAPELPMTPETITVWLSAGKPLTAVAIGQLVDAGKLKFDDHVVTYIPEFAPHGKDAITIRQLLTHTAGMRTIHTDWPRATWDETLATLCAAPMEKDWIPGQKAGYHAFTTWYILGEIVRRLTARPIETYLRDTLFHPLGMHHTYLAMTPAEYAAHRGSMAHLQRIIAVGGGAPARMESMNLDTPEAAENPRPAGGIRGPIRELGYFYESLLRALRDEPPAPLSPHTARLMTSRVRPGMYDHSFKTIIDWGLGFQLNSEHLSPNAPYNFGPYASLSAFGHGGFQASVGMADPAYGLVVAALFNGCPGEARHHERIRAFFATLYEELRLTKQ